MSENDIIEKMKEQVGRLEHGAEREEAIAREAEALARDERASARALRKEIGELEREDHDHHKPRKVKITMVVNGEPVVIEASEHERLAAVRLKALEETKNLGQPPENWEIKDEQGALLDPEKTVEEYHFEAAVTLFLSLKAGVQGGH